MPVLQFNGTATTSPTTIQFSENSISIFVQKSDGSANILQVSFDGGTTYKTLANQWDFISIDALLTEIHVQSDAGTANYEILVTTK